MADYPKSPKDMTNGMLYFPRMLDKIRLHLRGELHEDYRENFGALKAADGVCCNFLRVHHRDLIERVKQGGTDEERSEERRVGKEGRSRLVVRQRGSEMGV